MQLAEKAISREWVVKNPEYSDMEKRYSPANWAYVARNEREAYTAECPALGALPDLYGFSDACAMWIDTQLTAMFLSSGSRDATLGESITMFARSFAEQVRPYKLTELMLFFSKYRAGMWDESYIQFSPKRIGNCFFGKFIPERNRMLARIENEAQRERTESFWNDVKSGKLLTDVEWRTFKPWHKAGYALEDWRKHQHALMWWWHFKDLPYNGNTNNFSKL